MVSRSVLIISFSPTDRDRQNLTDIISSLRETYHSIPCYVAIVAGYNNTSPANTPLSNSWLVCDDNLSVTPSPCTNNKSHVSHVTWSRLIEDLPNHAPSNDDPDLEAIANDIHSLLDLIPWEVDEYCLMDVIVTVSKPINSCSLLLYGVLWRLRKWLNASINFINKDKINCPVMTKWSKCLPAFVAESITDIHLSISVLWKGPLSQCISNSSSTCEYLKYDGFQISLSTENESLLTNEAAGTGFSISSTYHPTHLEVVQFVDVRKFPLMWISPLQVKISISSTYCTSSTLTVFKRLFNQSTDVGILLRLCGYNPTSGCGFSHKTTEDWRLHVLEMEKPNCQFLSSYNSNGPFLLASCGCYDDDNVCCTAWLLRRPESMTNVKRTLLQLYTMELDTETSSSLLQLQLLNKDNQFIPYCREQFIEDTTVPFNAQVTDHLIPSKWPEIVALNRLEDIKKRIKRNNSELMLGGVSAPPPEDTIHQTTDILSCFTDDGLPIASSQLSPISKELDRPLPRMMDSGTSSSVSYAKILSNTPTTARKYHGVNYYLSEEDNLRNIKMAKIQQRYISRERSSNFTNYETPKSEWRKRRISKLCNEKKSMANKSEPIVNENCNGLLNNKTIDEEAENNKKPSNEDIVESKKDRVVETKSREDTKGKQTKWTKREMKKHLELLIVSSLKQHGVNKSHVCFKKCYVKLFKICKMFVKDLKPSSSDINKQIKQIVDRAIKQVVEFELDQVKNS